MLCVCRKDKKDKKDRNDDKDRSYGRRLSPSPTRARHKSRRQRSTSPPAHKRPRAAERSPSPPKRALSTRERRHKKSEARDSQEAPARAAPASPAILRRIRFPGRQAEEEPSTAPAQPLEDTKDLRGTTQIQHMLRSQQQNTAEREPSSRQPRATRSTAGYVPEEQFWQQRKGAWPPPRRDEGAFEASHRAPATEEVDRAGDRGKASVLARLTFLGDSPGAKQSQAASPSRDEKRRRQRSPDVRPAALPSGGDREAGGGPPHAEAGVRVTRGRGAIAVTYNRQHTSADPAVVTDSKSKALPARGRDLRAGHQDDDSASHQLDREQERDAPERSNSVQRCQESPPPPPREQHSRSTRRQPGHGFADVATANQHQGSRKRTRQVREDALEGARNESPAARSNSRGKSTGRVHDEGKHAQLLLLCCALHSLPVHTTLLIKHSILPHFFQALEVGCREQCLYELQGIRVFVAHVMCGTVFCVGRARLATAFRMQHIHLQVVDPEGKTEWSLTCMGMGRRGRRHRPTGAPG